MTDDLALVGSRPPLLQLDGAGHGPDRADWETVARAILDHTGAAATTDCDNCPTVANPDQINTDQGQTGDACDADDDNDVSRTPGTTVALS